VENLVGVALKAAEAQYGRAGLHFIRLMKAMLKNGGSLRVNEARYMCSELGITDVLGLPENHAISINTEINMFTFHTPADRAAAEQVLQEHGGHDDGHDVKFGPMPLAYSLSACGTYTE
jgi:hypothetical protein